MNYVLQTVVVCCLSWLCMCFCVLDISYNCVQWAEPRHYYRGSCCGGDHHPGVHGVWLHHWEKVRSRGPHWLSAPVSLRLSFSFSVTHRPPRLKYTHSHTLTMCARNISWHALLMDCDASSSTATSLPTATKNIWRYCKSLSLWESLWNAKFWLCIPHQDGVVEIKIPVVINTDTSHNCGFTCMNSISSEVGCHSVRSILVAKNLDGVIVWILLLYKAAE